jgi:hypothetical protein
MWAKTQQEKGQRQEIGGEQFEVLLGECSGNNDHYSGSLSKGK